MAKRSNWLWANGYVDERGRPSYREYTRSSRWSKRRRAYYENHPRQCWVCDGTEKVLLHHRSYENIGREPDEDLIPLCNRCHILAHALGDIGDGCIRLRINRDRYGIGWLDRRYAKHRRRAKRIRKRKARAEQARKERQKEKRLRPVRARAVRFVPPRPVTIKNASELSEDERKRYALDRSPETEPGPSGIDTHT